MKDNDNNNGNDGLNPDEFSEYLGKYNDYFERNKPNHSNLSFLDRIEQPTDDEIIELFITPEDLSNSVDISNYELKELGIPDAIKTLEGTEWKVSKLIWFKPEGRVISFALIKMSELLDIDIYPWVDILNESNNTIDISHEEVEIDSYGTKLYNVIKDEDYIEAARLRDWHMKLKDYINELNDVKHDVDESYKIIDKINIHKKNL